jgi:hypothetical protein
MKRAVYRVLSYALLLSLPLPRSAIAQSTETTFPKSTTGHVISTANMLYANEQIDAVTEPLQKAYLMKWLLHSFKTRPTYYPYDLLRDYEAITSAYEQQTGYTLGMVLPREERFRALAALETVVSTVTGATVGFALSGTKLVYDHGTARLDRASSFLRMSQALQFSAEDLINTAEELDAACMALFSKVNIRFHVDSLIELMCPDESSPNAFVERNVNPTVNWRFATAFTLEPGQGF